jgi:hypothetical protein
MTQPAVADLVKTLLGKSSYRELKKSIMERGDLAAPSS